jgi:hypothetical protein
LFGVAIGMPESHLNSVGMLCQSGQFNPAPHFHPEVTQSGGKQRFGIALRQHQRERLRRVEPAQPRAQFL